MALNRYHWGISHYIGSQLRQCVLDPDGATLYRSRFPKKLPAGGRRLFAPPAVERAETETSAEGGASGLEGAAAADIVKPDQTSARPLEDSNAPPPMKPLGTLAPTSMEVG